MHHRDLHNHHFHYTWNPEIVGFYIYKFFRQIAFSLLSVFVPIYLYSKLNYSIFEIMVFFLINQLFFILFIPFSGKVVQKIGVKHSIFLHLPAFAGFSYLLRFLSGNFVSDLWLIVIMLGVRSIPKAPYATAEMIFMSKHVLNTKGKEGKSLSYIKMLMIGTSLISPLFGGLISYYFGFDMFFNVAIAVLFLASLPLLITKDEYFKLDESPMKIMDFTFKKVPKEFKLGEFGKWFPMSALWVLWPLFMFIVVGNVSEVGLLVSASGILAMIVSFVVGRYIDKKSPKKLLSRMSKISTGVYFLRVLVPNPLVLMFTDALNKVINPLLMLPYNKYYYGYVKSKKNLLEMSIASNFVLEFFFSIGFFIFVFYFGIFELLNYEVNHIVFVSLFFAFGFARLLMEKISRLSDK